MTTYRRINIIEFKDYLYLRKNKLSSHVKWLHIRCKILFDNTTLWQLISLLNKDYIFEHEPSLTQLKKVEKYLEEHKLLN